MRLVARSCLTAFLLVMPVVSDAGPEPEATGRVAGRVIDEINGQPLPGVPVEVVGTDHVAYTDLDGRYALDLPVGAHVLRIALEGFAERTVNVDVTTDQVLTVDVSLALARYSEEVTVTAAAIEAQTSTLEAQLLERRRAGAVMDNLGALEMKQNADSNAAAALQRVTGLSVVDNQYVFVRGLGERYSNTTLGGATIPSTEPERRVVSLDMFPAGLLDSVSVVKSYTPDRPAEFAGGLVEIVPAKLPTQQMFDLSYSIGGDSQTLGETIIDHPGGDRDWLGFSDGSRELPAGIPGRRIIRGGVYTPELGFSRGELERFGELFPGIWEARPADGMANQGYSAVYGNRWGPLGLLASVNHSYRNHYQEEEQNYYRTEGGQLTPFSTYDYRSATNKATLAAVLGLAYQFTSSNRVALQAFSTNNGTRETRTFEGFNSDAARNLRNQRLLWREENLRSGQVSGEHLFSHLSNSRLEWRAAYSRSNRDEPDLRETLYEETGGRFLLADESQSGFRQFNDLDEDVIDLDLGWSTFFTNWNQLPTMVQFGPQFMRRERDFSSRRLRFIPIRTTGLDLSQQPESLLVPANIGPFFELREETRPTDFYSASQDVVAFYGMVDLPLSNEWRVVGGARIEGFEQLVDTFDLFDVDVDNQADVISAEIDKTDFFPSVNLVYAIRADQNLRFGVSQTVNRPEFRELAPFEFTDIVGGRAIVGNPDLDRSLIQNYDIRWEWFPGAEEVVAASFFVKRFDSPIERFVEPTAQLRTSFTNAKSARNVGLELETRARLAPALYVGANYTFVDSQIELEAFQTNVLTSLERPLAGTSKNIFNGVVETRVGDTVARLLVNYFGDRIVDVGSLGLPDIIETGRPSLDLAVSHRVRRLTLRFAAENLTDRAVRFEQGDQIQRRFTLGRTFGFQVSVSAF